MKEKIEIELKYSGPEVDDGTMSLEDMLPALQGFSSAYGKIVNEENLGIQHKLRVTGVRKGSFEIILNIAGDLINNYPTLTGIGTGISIGGIGKIIIGKIIGVIQVSKHVKNKSFTTQINGDGKVSIINIDKVSLVVPHDIFSLYQSGLLKPDLNKIAKPLEAGRIEETYITIKDEEEEIKENIRVDDKPYFDFEQVEVTKTETVALTGQLNSLTKSTNKGYFILNNGARVSYKLDVEEPELLYKYFIHKGPVKVKAIAHLDENLAPTMLDIQAIEALQPQLFKDEDND